MWSRLRRIILPPPEPIAVPCPSCGDEIRVAVPMGGAPAVVGECPNGCALMRRQRDEVAEAAVRLSVQHGAL